MLSLFKHTLETRVTIYRRRNFAFIANIPAIAILHPYIPYIPVQLQVQEKKMHIRALCITVLTNIAIAIAASTEMPYKENSSPAINTLQVSSQTIPVKAVPRGHNLFRRLNCNSNNMCCADDQFLCEPPLSCCPKGTVCVIDAGQKGIMCRSN